MTPKPPMNDMSQVKPPLKRCGICALPITEHEHWTAGPQGAVHFSCHLSDKLTTLQSQLTQAQSGWRTMQEKCERLEIQFAEITIQLTQAHKERDEKKSELAELWSKTETIINDRTKALIQERDEAVAAAAMMRECLAASRSILVHVYEWHYKHSTGDYSDIVHEQILEDEKALSTSTGKAFLERMKEAEWLLGENQKHVGYDGTRRFVRHPANAWIDRRDAWLKGGAK